MDKYLDDLCDEIDAAVFSGDAFTKEENRRGLTDYINRWQRELSRLEESMKNEDVHEAEGISTVDYEYCPHCHGSFSFRGLQSDWLCPFCKKDVRE